jgi:hypothetical protein
MARSFPNGIGESTGDTLITSKPLFASGQVWYLNFTTGTDAASPQGLNPQAPLKTLAQAITNAADNDIIVMLVSETVTAAVTVSKKVAIVGSGISAGVPSISIGINAAAASTLLITTPAVELRNLKFTANAQTNSSDRIAVSASDFRMVGCYVECAGTDEGDTLSLDSGADRARIASTTFISTATSAADLPKSAIVNSAAIADLELDGLIVSGGTVGFSSQFAVDLNAAAVTRVKGQSLSLLLGADMRLNSSSTGWVNVQTTTGAGRVEW